MHRATQSRYRAIVAFSGEHEYGGAKVTEASLNGFPSNRIADRIQEAFVDYYRATILAEETDPNKLHDIKAELDTLAESADACLAESAASASS